jgi:hypothetical protein
LIAAIPNRTWKGITARAERLKLFRARSRSICFRKWTQREDEQLGQLCKNGAKYEEIARELGRSVISVKTRIREKGLGAGRPNGIWNNRSNWDSLDLLSSQESSTGREIFYLRFGSHPLAKPPASVPTPSYERADSLLIEETVDIKLNFPVQRILEIQVTMFSPE